MKISPYNCCSHTLNEKVLWHYNREFFFLCWCLTFSALCAMMENFQFIPPSSDWNYFPSRCRRMDFESIIELTLQFFLCGILIKVEKVLLKFQVYFIMFLPLAIIFHQQKKLPSCLHIFHHNISRVWRNNWLIDLQIIP